MNAAITKSIMSIMTPIASFEGHVNHDRARRLASIVRHTRMFRLGSSSSDDVTSLSRLSLVGTTSAMARRISENAAFNQKRHCQV